MIICPAESGNYQHLPRPLFEPFSNVGLLWFHLWNHVWIEFCPILKCKLNTMTFFPPKLDERTFSSKQKNRSQMNMFMLLWIKQKASIAIDFILSVEKFVYPQVGSRWYERRVNDCCDMSMENMQTNQFDYRSNEIMWKSCFTYKSVCHMCVCVCVSACVS